MSEQVFPKECIKIAASQNQTNKVQWLSWGNTKLSEVHRFLFYSVSQNFQSNVNFKQLGEGFPAQSPSAKRGKAGCSDTPWKTPLSLNSVYLFCFLPLDHHHVLHFRLNVEFLIVNIVPNVEVMELHWALLSFGLDIARRSA